jgi:pimeloyl-ACP methyl ester carboxylesterase
MARSVTLSIASTSVHVSIHGRSGEPLVLIHGLSGSTAWWVRNVEALSENHTVYLLDLPGFGSMRRYAGQFSIAGSPAWVAAVMSALELQKAALIGHSMGALIAALFAAQFPDRTTNLVLAAPAITLLHTSVLPFLLPLFKQTMQMQPAFFPTLVRDAGRAGPRTLLRAARELLTMDVHAELASIGAPCLLLFGERDPMVPVSLGSKLQAEIKGSSLLLLPRAGHVLMYDRAELFNRSVLHFLSGGADPIGDGD